MLLETLRNKQNKKDSCKGHQKGHWEKRKY